MDFGLGFEGPAAEVEGTLVKAVALERDRLLDDSPVIDTPSSASSAVLFASLSSSMSS